MSTFKEAFEKQVHALKQGLEELSLQMTLGKKEAQDAYKKQKEQLKHWVTEKQPLFDEIKGEVSEDWKKVKAKFNELKQKLQKEPKTEDEIKEEHISLSATMDELQNEAEDLEKHADEDTKTFAASLTDQLGVFQTKMRKLGIAIKEEAQEEWEEFREENKDIVGKLKNKANDISEEAKEEWDELKSDAKKLFNKVRSKF